MDNVLAYTYLQTLPPPKPSWDSGYPSDCDDDDFFLSEPVNINQCVSGKCEINKEHEDPVRLVESEKDADLSLNPVSGDGESRNL